MTQLHTALRLPPPSFPQTVDAQAREGAVATLGDATLRSISQPRPRQAEAESPSRPFAQHPQPVNRSQSLHALIALQRAQIQATRSLILTPKNALNDMDNKLRAQLDNPDRQATASDLAQAKKHKSALTSLIATYRFQGMPHKQARREAARQLSEAGNRALNDKPWTTIDTVFTCRERLFQSRIVPAAQLKLGEQNIFAKSYNGKGVCSGSSANTEHATNLWTSEVNAIRPHGQVQPLFKGVRHGTLSPYGLKNAKARLEGAKNRAREVVTAALMLRPDILNAALNNDSVPLHLTSTSLLTAVNLGSWTEKNMLNDQIDAWRSLSSAPLDLQVRNAQGQLQTIKVDLKVAAFNFGVNEMALKLGLGNHYSDQFNAEGLRQLLGPDMDPESEPGGWVGHYLKNKPDNADKVRQLARQIRLIWQHQSHHQDEGEPYKAAQRIAMLTWEIGAVPCWNCKSGKDRTGMLDAELKREVISQHLGDVPTTPGAPLLPEQQSVLQTVLMEGGNMEVQAQNTGVGGNKVVKDLPFMNLSLATRVGDASVWSQVKGLSAVVSA
jgi:phosphatidylinositol-4,5-bisphosphate 4-phosphatase